MPSGLLIRLRGTIALAALNNFALFGAIFMFPLLLQRFFHDKPAQAGIELVPFLLTGVAGPIRPDRSPGGRASCGRCSSPAPASPPRHFW
ncbi:hypothetical protein GT370_07535 [Acidocella sp. MX-AZ03]|uniref:hypothetical protein n=1 Tax=Acidocella sp. MX-AZ03 TaxID=2697363 RepID=UPI0022DE5DEA|nr:hypothetical protein [Acidocella sp. MX-AZ03]WBO60613.1 hypothetical protein GT370_07535 [Acidocella sp. MX-AZ03]